MTIPPTPGPIKIEMKDGTTVGVECFYDGLEDGVHVWKVTNNLPINNISRVLIKRLPAHTSVVIRSTH